MQTHAIPQDCSHEQSSTPSSRISSSPTASSPRRTWWTPTAMSASAIRTIPKHFFLSRSVAPELVETRRHRRVGPRRAAGAATRSARSISSASSMPRSTRRGRISTPVVHAHAEDILPFGIAQATPLRPVIHSGSFIGANVPVWDIADKFGDTNLLVTNMDQGRDLAKCLAGNNVALMRGHGFASPRPLADRGGADVGLSAAQRARAAARQAARRRDQVSAPRARSTRAIAATVPIRPRPGAPGNTGRTRPAAATC